MGFEAASGSGELVEGPGRVETAKEGASVSDTRPPGLEEERVPDSIEQAGPEAVPRDPWTRARRLSRRSCRASSSVAGSRWTARWCPGRGPGPTSTASGSGGVRVTARWWRAATVATLSRDGRFEFEDVPAGEGEETVLWATCPGYLAASLHPDDVEGGVVLDLRPAEAFSVTVVDHEDGRLAGAFVALRGHAGLISAVGRSQEGRRRDRARRSLLRVVETSQDGVARLPAVEGRVMVCAEYEGAQSPIYLKALEGSLVLRIGPTFSAGGTVSLLPNAEFAVGDVWVECIAETGAHWDYLSRIAVGEDLRWSMDSVPWVACDKLYFRLHGGYLVGRDRNTPAPQPGEHVLVDFQDVGPGGVFPHPGHGRGGRVRTGCRGGHQRAAGRWAVA